jgi:type II secretion system protein N
VKIKLPNFTMTRGKIPEAGGRLRGMRRNMRSILTWGLAGMGFFVFFTWLSLPTRAIAWRISHEAKRHGYVVDIGDVSISPFGGVTLEEVQWTFEPSRPGDVPTKWFVDEVDVDVSLIKLLWGTLDVDVELQLEEGIVEANYTRSASSSEVSILIEELPLYAIPKARQALNAPLSGLFKLEVELTIPENKFSQATGHITVNCSSCTVGDGEEKLYVPGSAALKAGVVVPQVDIGNLSGKLIVEDGVATTEEPISTDSEDVWVFMEGKISLKDPFPKSRFDMVLKFNLSEKLQAESEPMRFMIQTAHKTSQLTDGEKGLGFILEGPVGKPRFRGIHTKSRREARADRREKQRKRDEARAKKKAAAEKKAKAKKDAAKKKKEEDDTTAKPLDIEPLDDDGGDKPALPPPVDEPGDAEPSADSGPSAEPEPEPEPAPEPEPEPEPAQDEGGQAEPPAEEGGEILIDDANGDNFGPGSGGQAEEPPAVAE